MQTIFTQLTTFLCLLFLITTQIRAQNRSPTQIPFQNVRNLIYISGTVNRLTGFFLVDTGYEGSILLNNNYFSGRVTDRILVGTNGVGSSLEVKMVDLQFGDLQTTHVLADIADMEHLESSLGIPMLGLIGSTFFRDFELLIDYTSSKMILTRLDRRGRKLAHYPGEDPPSDSLSFITKGHLPVFEAQVGGTALLLALDTGASANLFHHSTLKKLEKHISDIDELNINGFGLQPKKAVSGMLSKLVVQGLSFDQMQTLFYNLSHLNRELRGPIVDGILGLESFGQRKVAFNFKKQLLYVWEEALSEKASVDPLMVQNRPAEGKVEVDATE
jgi:hypothetical protein